MDSVLNKSSSESNLMQVDITPTNYDFVSQRSKKRRENEYDRQLLAFKDEIKLMIRSMMLSQEKEIKKITPVLMEIKQTNNNIESSITFLTEQNDALRKKVEMLEGQCAKDKEYITLLEDKIEDVQRGSRKTNIEIKNVPKIAGEAKENLINMVLELSNNIGCSINKSDIKDIYRVQGRNDGKPNTPIIVETSSTLLKTEILKTCKIYNGKHKQKLCAKHLGLTTKADTPVFVSEQLTARGARLHFLARDLSRSKEYKFCWTAYGRVYIRKNENSPIIMIRNETQVHNLLQKP